MIAAELADFDHGGRPSEKVPNGTFTIPEAAQALNVGERSKGQNGTLKIPEATQALNVGAAAT